MDCTFIVENPSSKSRKDASLMSEDEVEASLYSESFKATIDTLDDDSWHIV
jgi:hypothetical protein